MSVLYVDTIYQTSFRHTFINSVQFISSVFTMAYFVLYYLNQDLHEKLQNVSIFILLYFVQTVSLFCINCYIILQKLSLNSIHVILNYSIGTLI